MPANPKPDMSRSRWRNVAEYTYRLEVPGGWLYRYDCIGSYGSMEGNLVSASMVFVADPGVDMNEVTARPSYRSVREVEG